MTHSAIESHVIKIKVQKKLKKKLKESSGEDDETKINVIVNAACTCFRNNG